MAEDPPAGAAAADGAPGGVADAAGPASFSTTSAAIPSNPNPTPLPPAAPARRPRPPPRPFPRPRVLPWLGLLLLLGCVAELLRTASPPGFQPPTAGVSRRPPSTAPPGVILDAGHGGADTGAVANGLSEKDLTLDLVRRVAAVLEGRGIAARLTRTDDRYVPLATRAMVANASPRAIFVSIHLNHAATGASGIETFYSQQKDPLLPPPLPASAPARLWQWVAWLGVGAPGGEGGAPPAAGEPFSPEGGQALATCVQSALVASTSAANRGVKERALYVTRHVQAPAVLVEGGFLSNPSEARQLADPAYRQRLAESIADGIGEYLRSARRHPVPEQNRAGV